LSFTITIIWEPNHTAIPINTAMATTIGLMNERPVDAIFLLGVVEPKVAPAVAVPLELVEADCEVDGLGHALLYTNC
jgi:hypothetical protein